MWCGCLATQQRIFVFQSYYEDGRSLKLTLHYASNSCNGEVFWRNWFDIGSNSISECSASSYVPKHHRCEWKCSKPTKHSNYWASLITLYGKFLWLIFIYTTKHLDRLQRRRCWMSDHQNNLSSNWIFFYQAHFWIDEYVNKKIIVSGDRKLIIRFRKYRCSPINHCMVVRIMD